MQMSNWQRLIVSVEIKTGEIEHRFTSTPHVIIALKVIMTMQVWK